MKLIRGNYSVQLMKLLADCAEVKETCRQSLAVLT